MAWRDRAQWLNVEFYGTERVQDENESAERSQGKSSRETGT
jgi:hypothetical protein